ncbi:MAG: GNAT family N-acetyltransferase [Spirochaetales bacterium]|nr:GNAT family N-acetyltransferase [Spirochaetales bacterium]
MNNQDIAIIGISIKLPQANDIDDYWYNLKTGKNVYHEIDNSRWNIEECYSPQIPHAGKTYSKWAGLIDDISLFDPNYFNIREQEIKFIAPMQLKFLEIVNNLLDTSGYAGNTLWGTPTGVFVGAPNNPYYSDTGIHSLNASGMHNSNAMIANRVSQFFNLKGPSKAIDTICSSSLVAIHAACNSIRHGECSVAIAGGISLLSSMDHFILLSQMQLLSATNQCRPFDVKANGFVLSEGGGAFLLKPLEQAWKDKDQIWGVIKGTGINHNGYTENSMLPDAYSISTLIQSVLENYNIDAETISYIETNASGSTLGDAIEIKGLIEAFKPYTRKNQFCGLGAVKSNIGNLEAASGIGALAKGLLILKYGKLIPNLNFTTLNPLIKLKQTPFYICSRLSNWTTAGRTPRRLGINGFGIGGTNAFLVIEEPPQYKENLNREVSYFELNCEREPHLFCLSAKSSNSLKELCLVYKNYLECNKDISLLNFFYTNNTTRSSHDYRLSIIFYGLKDLLSKLEWIYEHFNNYPDKSDDIFLNLIPEKNNQSNNHFFKSFKILYKSDNNKENKCLAVQNAIYMLMQESGQENRIKESIDYLNSNGIIIQDTISVIDKDFMHKLNNITKKQYVLFLYDKNRFRDEQINELKSKNKNARLIAYPGNFLDDYYLFLKFAAAIYVSRGMVDFNLFYKEKMYKKVRLPLYPYDYNSYHVNDNSNNKQIDYKPSSEDPHQFKKTDSLSVLQSKLEAFLLSAFCDILNIPTANIGVDTNFASLNVDSIFIMKIINYIKTNIDVNLTPVTFFNIHTISVLAGHITNLIKNGTDSTRKENWDFYYSNRIKLIPADKEHFPLIKKWMQNTDIHQWLDPFFHRELTIREYSYFIKRKDKKTYIIEFDKQPIGVCGLVNIDLINNTAESWIAVVDHDSRSKGIPYIAGIELCRKAFFGFKYNSLIARIRDDNVSSLVLTRSGDWRLVGILEKWIKVDNEFYDCKIFQLMKTDFFYWLKQNCFN